MAARAPGAPAAAPGAVFARNRALIATLVILATILQTLDTTIANVALPRMRGALSATQEEMGWVLTSYIVGTAITITLSGWAANQFGRRKVFLLSIALFGLSSAVCGMATSLPQLVAFRFLQGIGGAGLSPLAQATMLDISEPKHYGRAMALWAGASNLGPIMGPVLGGWLTQYYNWRWVFFINVPLGAIAFFGLLLTMPETPRVPRTRFDFFGFAMLSVAIASLQMMLDRGQLLDWFASREIVVEAAVAGLSFYLFLVHNFSASHAFLNPALFKDRNFVAASSFIALLGVVLFATLALLPPLLQNQMQYPILLAGLVTAPRGVAMMVTTIVVGRWIAKLNVRVILIIGLSMTAFSLWQMTRFSLLMGIGPVISSGIIQGLGLGIVFVPTAAVAFSTLPASVRNEGTAFFSLMRNLGSSIGISVVFFTLTRNTQRLHAALAANVTPYNVASNPALATAHLDARGLTGLAGLDAMISNQAAMMGFIDDFKLMMVLTLLTIPIALLVREARRPSAAVAVVE